MSEGFGKWLGQFNLDKLAGAASVLAIGFGAVGLLQNAIVLYYFDRNIFALASNADIIGGAYLAGLWALMLGVLVLAAHVFLAGACWLWCIIRSKLWAVGNEVKKLASTIRRRKKDAAPTEASGKQLDIGNPPQIPDFVKNFHFLNLSPWILDLRLVSVVIFVLTILTPFAASYRIAQIKRSPYHLIADEFNPKPIYGIAARLGENTVLVELSATSLDEGRTEWADLWANIPFLEHMPKFIATNEDKEKFHNKKVDAASYSANSSMIHSGDAGNTQEIGKVWRTVQIKTSLIKALVSDAGAASVEADEITQDPADVAITQSLLGIANELRGISQKLPLESHGSRPSRWEDLGLISKRIDGPDAPPDETNSPRVFWRGFESGSYSDSDIEAAKTFLSAHSNNPELEKSALASDVAEAYEEVSNQPPHWRLERLSGSSHNEIFTLSEIADIIRESSSRLDSVNRPLTVQLLGYADASGPAINNLTLSNFRAAVVEGEVRAALAEEIARDEIATVHCFVGENWHGSDSDQNSDTWLRRVEIRWGDRFIRGSNCSPITPR